jgi:hypothetical protein
MFESRILSQNSYDEIINKRRGFTEMKKTIAIAITSFTLLLAGSSLTASVASASTAAPDTVETYIYHENAPATKIHPQLIAKDVSLRVTSQVSTWGWASYDGSGNLIANTYGSGASLKGSLYYDATTNTFRYLINDPSTYWQSWVNPNSVKVI